MAKETQKEKIARLENKVSELQNIINRQAEDIIEMQERANEAYANSTDKKQLEDKLEHLEIALKSAEKSKEHAEKWLNTRNQQIKELKKQLTDVQKLNIEKKHNERGAGRKELFTLEEKETMKMYRLQGKTIAAIAEMYGCSVGLVHKIINEKN